MLGVQVAKVLRDRELNFDLDSRTTSDREVMLVFAATGPAMTLTDIGCDGDDLRVELAP